MSNHVFDTVLANRTSNSGKIYSIKPRAIYGFFTDGAKTRFIPNYQRPYSWNDGNILDLLNDIYQVSINEDDSWFLGPIFTVDQQNEDNSSAILDGQQRLTTIQIILKEITLLKLHFDSIDEENNSQSLYDLNRLITACNNCLTYQSFNQTDIKLLLEETTCDIFKKYILELDNFNSLEDINSKRLSLYSNIAELSDEGITSAKTLEKAITIVSKFLYENFVTNKSFDIIENLERLCRFGNSLLWKCWVIEIPLIHSNESVKIFEALNNRGKPLTLVDKLRYKSLILVPKFKIYQIKSTWKTIFKKIEKIESSYISSDEDFFKVLFNSLDEIDRTNDKVIVEYFDKEFNDINSINLFFSHSTRILDFLEFIKDSLSENNRFIQGFPSREQNTIRALFELLKRALAISKNSRYLVFSVIISNSDLIQNSENIVKSIWDIIRIVFIHEIVNKERSNVTRNNYKRLIRSINENEFERFNLFEYFRHNIEPASESVLNAISLDENEKAKFIIYLYSFLSDYNSIISGNAIQYKHSELDHLFPKSWQKHWSNHLFTRVEVINYLETVYANKIFKSFDLELLIDEIKRLKAIQIETTENTISKECLLEFIGNKWVLNSSVNIKTSNTSFSAKKEKYLEDNFIKVPSNSDPVGITKYIEFNYKTIIDRSIQIIEKIMSDLEKPLSDVGT